jgi:hypothetical protein
MTESLFPPNAQTEPFAGRQSLLVRLYHQFIDPSHRHAHVFTGHEGMGKTRLLQTISRFDDPILCAYFPLINLADEDAWLNNLIAAINQILEERQFSISRVPQMQGMNEQPLRDWFRNVYLPEIFNIVRSHRRLVLLFDNAEALLTAPEGHLNYLHTLLQEFRQLSIILAISTEEENALNRMHPLVNLALAERIHRLNLEETGDLIRQYAAGAEDEMLQSIYEATGGHPRLLSRFGQALEQAWATSTNSQAFSQAKSLVYQQSREEFRQLWLNFSQDERLVLTALASLVYENPLQAPSVQALETWLVETDYPMDIVAINAALRSLDYHDMIYHHPKGGVALVTGFMQQWLLENARLDEGRDNGRGRLSKRLLLTVALVILLLVALLFLIPLPLLRPDTLLPTATWSS